MKYCCFDVGGTEIKYGIVDDEGNLYEHGSVLRDYRTDEVAFSIAKIAEKFGYKFLIISMHGYIRDEEDPLIPRKKLEEMGYEIYMTSEISSHLYAEHTWGNLKDVKNALSVTIGTGFSFNLLKDGVVFDPNCHNYNIEEYADDLTRMYHTYDLSFRHVLDQYIGSKERIDGIEFMKRLDTDLAAQKILNEHMNYLIHIVQPVHEKYHFQKIMIVGGITNSEKYRKLLLEKAGSLPITFSRYCGHSATVGALADYLSFKQ